MNWSAFLTKIDWLTGNDGSIDYLFEELMTLKGRERMIFLEQFTPFDKHKQPKSMDDIAVEIIIFRESRR